MKEALEAAGDEELGIKLGVQAATTFKVWRNRKAIPQNYYAYASEKSGKSIQWLKTGSDERLRHVTAVTPQPDKANDTFLGVAQPAVYKFMAHDSSHGEIDLVVFSRCMAACSTVYGDGFSKLSDEQQIVYAGDFYNLLVRMCRSQGADIGVVRKLETDGLMEQLGVFIKLGWVMKFPPPQTPSLMF